MAKRENLFSFKGRLDRAEFWRIQIGLGGLSSLAFVLVGLLAWALSRILGLQGVGLGWMLGAGIILTLAVFAAASAAAAVRRFHDLGASGWWVLGSAIAAIAFFVTGVIAISYRSPVAIGGAAGFFAVNAAGSYFLNFRNGTTGENRFGPPPAPAERSPVQPEINTPPPTLDERMARERAALALARSKLSS